MSAVSERAGERGLDIALLEDGHVASTARVLARAMAVDSGWRYLFPRDAERPAGLVDIFTRNLRMHLPHGCTRVALDGWRVVGTATLRPPGGIDTSRLAMIRSGLLPFAFANGAGALRRLLWLKDTYDGFEEELAEGRPYWHLHMMAVDPEQQGRGAGSWLLDRVLAETARDPSTPVVLTTHLERNLPFYARVGFETRWERTLEPPDGEPYRIWGMARA